MNSRWSDSLGRLSIPLVQAEFDLDSVDIDELDSTIEAVGALARGFHSIASQRPRPLRRDAYVASAMAYDILESLLRWQGGLRTMASDALLHRDRAWALADDLQSHLQMARLEPSLSGLLATWCQDVPECRSLRAVAALLKSRPFVAHVAVFEVLDQEDEMREYRARMLRDFGSVPVRFADAESTPPPLPMTIRVRVLIGGTPAVARQAVAANVLHEITVGLSIAEWRGGDTGLEFDFISTLPLDSWDGPRFSFMPWPEGESTREGRLLFKAAIMPDSKPIILQARIRHRASGDWPEPTLVGDTELHVVPTSPESYPQLSTYPTLDWRLPGIMREVNALLPRLPQQAVGDLQNLLVALMRYAGAVMQSGTFKGRPVDEERDFQPHILEHLRMVLGSEVVEGSLEAGGRIDLRFREIVIELKVERRIRDREILRRKYVEQPAQYTAHGLPISVVCILDMVEKDRPPSNLVNNISVEVAETHGVTNPGVWPSVAIVLFVDANLRSPSSYSR